MLTHVNEKKLPAMVDVSAKTSTKREATAESRVILPEETLRLLRDGEISTAKGPVFNTAIIAGVMAVKRTSELIPFCHPIPLENCQITIEVENKKLVVITCTAMTTGKTGVEMEALTGATVAALTVYDMCKSMSHNITIKETRLLSKRGGKSDFLS
ncbi:MAG: cyclic pyranopterin phosphate synthase [Chlamydiales bacterium]|jgi:cyclic pyranopterin phosphate synthase